MLSMKNFLIKTGDAHSAVLGYEGENNSRILRIKTTDSLTDFATVNLLIDTFDCGAMTVETVSNYKVLSMVLTAAMLGEAGKKTCQLLMMDSEGTVIKKSNQFLMVVGVSNVIEGTVPDSPVIVVIGDYVEEKISELIDEVGDTVDLHTEEIEELQGDVDHLKNGEVVINGILIQGFYPVATGTISTASSSARTVVFPIESDKTYYVSWLEGTNKYRVAFGDTPADQIVDGTVIYNYIDAASLSHDHLSVTNDDHQYMYVYIGTTASATIDTISVVKSASFIEDLKEETQEEIVSLKSSTDSNLVDINYPGLWMSTDLNHRGRGDGSQDAKNFFYHSNVSLRPSVKYLDVNEDARIQLLGLDSAYKPLSNPFIFRYGDTEHTSPIDDGYRIDLDSVRKANPSAEYILAACSSVKNIQRNLLVDSERETESPAYSSGTVYSGYYYPSEYALPYFSQEGCVFTLTAEYEIIGNAVESGVQIYGQINNSALVAVSSGYGSSCNEDIHAGDYVGVYKRSCKLSAAQAAAENKRIRFGLKLNPTPGTVLKIRRIKFEFGMVSTGWTPAPEDTGETFVEPVRTLLTAQYVADHVKMLALPSYRWWGNETDYKITPYDWTNAYRTSSTFRIISGSDNALSYLVIPRINMRTGDYIEAFLPDGYQSLCWTQTNDYAEDLYFPSYDGPYTEKRAIYRAYRDCTMCFHVRTTPDLTPINPVTCPVEVYIHRRKDSTRVNDRNLLVQSRYSEAGGTPLTLIHYSDNHGSVYGLEELERYYCENFNYIDDYLNTGDTVYSYYGFSIDGDPAPDYDETVTYSVDDYAVNSGWLYKCTASTSGVFDSTKWTKLAEFGSNEINAGRMYDSRKKYLNSDLAKHSLFVLGNHDTCLADWRTATNRLVTTDTWHLLKQSDAYNSYFAPFIQGWGVTMGSATNACYWYKDYANAKIRLIGVDMAYWDSTEATWLTNTLAGARTNGYSVILASHYRFGPSTYDPTVSFQTLKSLSDAGNYTNSSGYAYGTYTNGDAIPILAQYEDIIICHLCGHWHADTFGYYDDVDILIVGINQAGGEKEPRSEVRLGNMENKWLFNATTFNTTDKTVKIVRIGQDTDETLRRKKTLVYNYDTKTIISNN